MRRRLLPLSLAPWALRVGVIAATIGLSACGGDGGGSAAGGPPSSGGTPPPTTPPTASAPAGSTGSAGAGVDPGGVRADGRSLDVTIRVAVPADVPGGSYFGEDSLYGLVAEDCAARDGDELTQLGPRCIQSADGRDISYSFGGINDRGVLKATDRAPHPTAVGLLIEQGDAGLSSTWMPNEPRLFSAKLFTDGLLPDTRVALAAFASDEASGSASSLPQRPVTFFPVQSPGFSTSKSEAFAVLQNCRPSSGAARVATPRSTWRRNTGPRVSIWRKYRCRTWQSRGGTRWPSASAVISSASRKQRTSTRLSNSFDIGLRLRRRYRTCVSA